MYAHVCSRMLIHVPAWRKHLSTIFRPNFPSITIFRLNSNCDPLWDPSNEIPNTDIQIVPGLTDNSSHLKSIWHRHTQPLASTSFSTRLVRIFFLLMLVPSSSEYASLLQLELSLYFRVTVKGLKANFRFLRILCGNALWSFQAAEGGFPLRV